MTCFGEMLHSNLITKLAIGGEVVFVDFQNVSGIPCLSMIEGLSDFKNELLLFSNGRKRIKFKCLDESMMSLAFGKFKIASDGQCKFNTRVSNSRTK